MKIKLPMMVLLASVVSLVAHAGEGVPSLDSSLPRDYTNVCKNISVSHMPPVQSVGGIPMCAAQVALDIWLLEGCKRTNVDCTTLDPKNIPSVLSMRALSEEADVAQKMRPPGAVQLKKNNPLSIFNRGSVEFTLVAVRNASMASSESCYSYKKSLSKYTAPFPTVRADEARGALLRLRDVYLKIDLHSPTNCPACLAKMIEIFQDDFDITRAKETIIGSLKSDEIFDQFLNRMLFYDCHTASSFEVAAYDFWPKDTGPTTKRYIDSLNQIKKVLSHDRPIALSFCLNAVPSGDLEKCDGHVLSVTGSRRICKASAVCGESETSDCKEQLQVQNVWGALWQKQNNDGWVDAKTLLKYADIGRSTQLLYFDTPGLK